MIVAAIENEKKLAMKILENEDFLLDMQITDQVDLDFMTGEHFWSNTFLSIMYVKIKLFDISNLHIHSFRFDMTDTRRVISSRVYLF